MNRISGQFHDAYVSRMKYILFICGPRKTSRSKIKFKGGNDIDKMKGKTCIMNR